MESTGRKTAIIQLRKQLHISQAKLGQAIDLSQSIVSAWESGYTELPEATVVEMGNYLIDEQAKLAAIAFPKFNTPVEVAWMDSTFEWEDELAEMMQQWAAELPNLTAQVDIDRAEAQKGTTNGIDLTPIFAQIESFMYRIAKLERQNLEFETRIAELEAARHAPPEFSRLTVKMNLEAKQREMRKRYVRKPKARGPSCSEVRARRLCSSRPT